MTGSAFHTSQTLLTHQSAEGDDGQQSLDQNPEPVRQSSVIAAVRNGVVNVGHIRDLQGRTVQNPSDQEKPAVSHQVHDDPEGKRGNKKTERFFASRSLQMSKFRPVWKVKPAPVFLAATSRDSSVEERDRSSE